MTAIHAAEAEKYAAIWALPQYQNSLSCGEGHVETFATMSGCKPGDTVIDLGCGQGRGGKALQEKYGLVPTYLDLVRAEGCPELFRQQPMWQPIGWNWYEHGYCCDVMEHIPEQFTMLSVHNALQACTEGVFFSISFEMDRFGDYLGDRLHLTIKPFEWWRDTLREIGEVVEARDLIGSGVFYVRAT